MFREIIWLVGFALTILAIVLAIRILAPQTTQTLEVRDEPTSLEKAARSILDLAQ